MVSRLANPGLYCGAGGLPALGLGRSVIRWPNAEAASGVRVGCRRSFLFDLIAGFDGGDWAAYFKLGSALPGIAEDPPVQIFTKETRIPFMDPNSHEALLRRRKAAMLTWRGPALMLFARAACAVGAQAVVVAVFALRA